MTTSFLDNDFYNFTMAQFIWKYFPELKVGYRFKNRSATKLAKLKWALEESLAGIAPRPTLEDIKYLESTNLFEKEFLYDLLLIEQPKVTVTCDFDAFPELVVTYEGRWWESVFLETPILARLAQLVNSNHPSSTVDYRMLMLNGKMDFLKLHPFLNFTEFGTRRRASADWQHTVLGKLVTRRPYQLQGTSNVALAQEFGIAPVGTMAHQLFMVLAAYYGHNTYTAQDAIQYYWNEMYGSKGLMTVLTDTFGTDHFLKVATDIDLDAWSAYRQDSGDPVEWGRKMLKRFATAGIDPRSKVFIFSDGLTPQMMLDIWGQFGTLTNVSFGWGTNLTNDCGVPPLSIIIKPDYVLDKGLTKIPCIKLSDNLDKSTGDSKIVELYKEKCRYNSTFSKPPIY